MRQYIGTWTRDSEWRVMVEQDGKSPRPLDLHLSVRNHSPAGFAWGYAGSGPAQLALALLIDAVGIERAVPIYQAFKFDRIAPLPQSEGWTMDSDDLIRWAEGEERHRAADRARTTATPAA